MELTIRPMTRTEDMYAYTQSSQIMDRPVASAISVRIWTAAEPGFFSSWEDHRRDLKTDLFKAEFDSVINALRFDSRYGMC